MVVELLLALILLSSSCISQPAHASDLVVVELHQPTSSSPGTFFVPVAAMYPPHPPSLSLELDPRDVLWATISPVLSLRKKKTEKALEILAHQTMPVNAVLETSIVGKSLLSCQRSEKAHHIHPAKMHMHHGTFRDTPLWSWLCKSRWSL